MTHEFFSLHRQGFVRVARLPRIEVGDPAANAAETLAMMHDGEARHVDLMLFPELGLSAYAIDDLLLQDALLDAVEAELRASWTCRKRCVRCSCSEHPAAERAAVQLRDRGVAWTHRGRRAEIVPAELPRVLRASMVRAWCGADRTRGERRRPVPLRTDLVFAASGIPDFIFHLEICEDFWAATPPSTRGALAGALIL